MKPRAQAILGANLKHDEMLFHTTYSGYIEILPTPDIGVCVCATLAPLPCCGGLCKITLQTVS